MLKKAPGFRLQASGYPVVTPEFEDAAPSPFSQAELVFTTEAWSLEPGAFLANGGEPRT
jgi:hypothetical protein